MSQRSGLASGSIYWHFDSKEALLGAVVEEGARRWFASFPPLKDLPVDPVARSAAVFDSIETSLELQPEFLRLLLLIALERRGVDPRSLAAIRRVRDLALEHIRHILVDLLAPLKLPNVVRVADEFAGVVLVAADGAFVAHHIDPEKADIRRSFGLLRRALTALAREMRDSIARKSRR